MRPGVLHRVAPVALEGLKTGGLRTGELGYGEAPVWHRVVPVALRSRPAIATADMRCAAVDHMVH